MQFYLRKFGAFLVGEMYRDALSEGIASILLFRARAERWKKFRVKPLVIWAILQLQVRFFSKILLELLQTA